MADSPQAGGSLTDDEFLALVDEEFPGETTPAADDPELETPAPARADKADEVEEPESPTVGDDDVIDEFGTQAPAPPATIPVVPAGAKPWQFKASGGVHTLAGALEMPDGSIVIPKASQAEIRTRLASQVELAANYKNLQRDSRRAIQAAKADRTDKDIEADAVIALFGDIKKMTPDERWEYFEKFEQEIPKLELEVQKKQLERDRKALAEQRNPTPTAEEQTEQRTELLTNELKATYRRVMENPAVKVLAKEDIDEVFRKHAARADRLVAKGEKEGEEIFDDAEVVEDINLLIRAKQRSNGALTAKDKNELRNADTNQIPPVVTPRTPAGEPRQRGQKSYKGKQREFKDDFMKGVLDSE